MKIYHCGIMANGNPTYIYTANYIYIYMFLGFIVLIEMMRSGYKEQGLYIEWNKFLCCCSICNYILNLNSNPPCAAKKGAKTNDSTAMSLMRIFRDGPDVSFSGSPMVSPMTAAL